MVKLQDEETIAPISHAFDWIDGLGFPLALTVDGLDGLRFTRASAGLLHVLGLSAAAVVGRRIDSVLPGEIHRPLCQAILRVLDSATSAEVILSVRLEGRRPRRVAFIIHPVRAPARGAIVEARSRVAPRKAADERRRLLIEHLNLINAGTTYVYDRSPLAPFNLATLLGFQPDAGDAPRSTRALIHPLDLPAFLDHRLRLASAADGEIVRVTARMRHRNGEWRSIEVREQVLSRTARGSVRKVLGFATDVTEHHVLLASLRHMSTALMKAEAEERRRIARELHNSMAQHLVVIDLTLSRLQREAGGQLPVEALKDIREALKAAHSEARTFSYLLHPPDLDRLGLAGTLRQFVTGFGRRTGLETRLVIDTEASSLWPAAELTFFRVAQEALMNVHQHAGARTIEVHLREGPDQMVLEVIDDGVGLSDGTIEALLLDGAGGVGIAGMKARMEQFGGRLEISSPAQGLRVRASLPCDGQTLDMTP